ncbi:MAG TPA: hypothetical protein VIM65_11670 [Cyclobacteriaceae bacterium]
MKMRITVLILFACVVFTNIRAQINKQKIKRDPSPEWLINEIYASDDDKRFGLFLEVQSKTKKKISSNLFASVERDYPWQFKLKSRTDYNPDIRKKGYNAVKISAVRMRARTIKLYNRPDSIFLFRRINDQFLLEDAFPILWNDSLSIGRCDGKICKFNIPTPGRPNKNVEPWQYMPRKFYRVSILGGGSTANNTGFAHTGYYPAYGVKVQKVVNRRLYYLTTMASIFQQGYSFNQTETFPTSTRKVNGHYSGFQFYVGKEAGVFVTPRFDLTAGAAIVLYTYAHQVYDETFIINSTTETTKHDVSIENYQLPVMCFNFGLNYQLTPIYRIELFSNLVFRTYQKNETIYYRSLSIGLSRSLRIKGRGYREPLLSW